MSRNRISVLVLFIASLSACGQRSAQTEDPVLCTDSWFQSVEQSISTGDGMGHGPDIGSDEWKSVVEFKLGVRGESGVPDRTSQEWCNYIAQRI